MPWREATKMDERRKLIEKWQSRLYTITELADQAGVSRPTVYSLIARYQAEGEAGLQDRPPMPKTFPRQTEETIANRIIEAKLAYPKWGPAKLIPYLRKLEPTVAWPAPSTAAGILDAHGLVKHKRKRRRSGSRTGQRLIAPESGQMLTTDHMGWIRTRDGRPCYPLTIGDPVSRYIYAIAALSSTSAEEAKPIFTRVFQEYGLPDFIGSDNGCPFSSNALGGLSRLVVWWIRLGVKPVRIPPGCPWDNGRHERMHKTLRGETARPPAENREEQQHGFDRFRVVFNTIRPHESLDNRTPAELLAPCPRPFPERLPELEYPGYYEIRRVRPHGQIKWKGGLLFLSETLEGETVGLEEIDDGIWIIHFGAVELARLDERNQSITKGFQVTPPPRSSPRGGGRPHPGDE